MSWRVISAEREIWQKLSQSLPLLEKFLLNFLKLEVILCQKLFFLSLFLVSVCVHKLVQYIVVQVGNIYRLITTGIQQEIFLGR